MNFLFYFNTDNAVKFSKQMAENFKLHDVQNNFENYEFPGFDPQIVHQLFYVVDFQCKNAVDLLIKVCNLNLLEEMWRKFFCHYILPNIIVKNFYPRPTESSKNLIFLIN